MPDFIRIGPTTWVRADHVCAIEEQWSGAAPGAGRFLRTCITTTSGHIFFTLLSQGRLARAMPDCRFEPDGRSTDSEGRQQ